MIRIVSPLLGLIAAIVLLDAATAADGPLTAQELRGKRIYVEGEAESGAPITALVSRGGTPVPASILPCAGCHGEDGKGRPEGGVVPADITWQTLAAPYGHDHDYGRKHPPFDENSVARAVILGVDPAGNALDAAMPRYEMPEEEMGDLVAYLKRISDDLDPGLSDDAVRVGSLLPLTGELGPLGQAMKNVLDATFAEINAGGGINGRKLELVAVDAGDDPLDNLWRLRDLLRDGTVFALVSSYAAGADSELAAMAEELEVPVIGPFTQRPQPGNGLDRQTFYLSGGFTEQARVLLKQALSDAGGSQQRVAIVHVAGPEYNDAIDRLRADLDARGAPKPVVISYQPPYLDKVDLVNTLTSRDVGSVLFLTPADELRRFAAEAARSGYAPTLLLPGVFAGKPMFDIDASFGGRLLIGYPSVPADHTPEGVRNFEALHAKHGFGYEYSPAQISAYVAARVFAEGLKRAGRGLSRDKLLAALEGISDFRAGLMPPISYNRSRRIGAYGGYIVELDLQNHAFGATSNWISLEL